MFTFRAFIWANAHRCTQIFMPLGNRRHNDHLVVVAQNFEIGTLLPIFSDI